MAYYEYLWSDEPGGKVEHIAEHGLTPDDFEFVFEKFEGSTMSEASGCPVRFGYSPGNRYVMVVFEWVEKNLVVLPVTAYEVSERKS